MQHATRANQHGFTQPQCYAYSSPKRHRYAGAYWHSCSKRHPYHASRRKLVFL